MTHTPNLLSCTLVVLSCAGEPFSVTVLVDMA